MSVLLKNLNLNGNIIDSVVTEICDSSPHNEMKTSSLFCFCVPSKALDESDYSFRRESTCQSAGFAIDFHLQLTMISSNHSFIQLECQCHTYSANLNHRVVDVYYINCVFD